MSLFITFEGGEGSGKSTQAKTLYRRLLHLKVPAVFTFEPGGTLLGNRICHWVKRGGDISPETELLLFNASRAHLVRKIIQPALIADKVVICDRYTESTLAYQGYGRGLDLEMIKSINTIATGGLRPDLIIFMDIDPVAGLARKNREQDDRFEKEELAFHQRVRWGFLEMARAEPQQWLIVDAGNDRKGIAQIIWQRVSTLL